MRMLLAFTAAVILTLPADAAPITPVDRQHLLAHLAMTESWLANELAGLTPAQQTFRRAPGTWHILDVVEHLAVAEPQYWKMVQDSMAQPPSAAGISATDADILWYGIDRTRRDRTGEAREPRGKYKDVPSALQDFRTLRATITAFAMDTQDDLRGRKLVEGNMSVYQWLLMISTHSQRHILQIREIKDAAGFPAGK
jgi:DinB family protein